MSQDPYQALLDAAEAAAAASPWLSIKQLAERLGVSVRTIRRWHAKGEGPERTKRGRRKMYHKDAVDRWLASQQIAGDL